MPDTTPQDDPTPDQSTPQGEGLADADFKPADPEADGSAADRRAADTSALTRDTTRGTVLEGVPHEPGVAKPDPILVVDGVRRSYGGLVAVDVEHLEIQRGIITGLIGPNGAGKTTFFNLMTGFDKPDTGTWHFDGRDLAGVSAHEVAHSGMVRTFQLTKALARLSVMENMKLGAPDQIGESFVRSILPAAWRSEEREIEARCEELLERFNLIHMRDEYGATLSGGQRKLLEMARTLMTDPSLLMLDEPMAGVNPALTQSLLDHVVALPSHGQTVVFVEHDMDVIMNISDWIVVMAEGKIIAEGPPSAIASNTEVIDAYLGAHHDDASVYDEGPIDLGRLTPPMLREREAQS